MIKFKSLFTDYSVLIFLIIFVSSETVLFGTNNNSTFIELKNIFVFSLFPLSCFMLYKVRRSFVLPHSMLLVSLLFALLLLCCSIVNGFTPGYISRFLLIISGFNIAVSINRTLFWSAFEKIVFFFACYSLSVYFINLFVPQIVHIFPVIENTANYRFHNLLFCFIPINEISVIRLFGPFREPGVFQMFLIMGLMTHWLQSNTIKGIRLSIYIVAILLTFSTTGYISLAILIVGCRLSQSNNGLKGNILYILLFLIFLAIYLYTDILSTEGQVFGKLNEENASTVARFGSIMGNLHIFSSSPFFGVGLLSVDELFDRYISGHYFYFTASNTNTILLQFSTFGLFFGLLWSYGFCRFWGDMSSKILPSFLFVVLGLVLFSGENLTGNILTYIIIGYGLLNSQNTISKGLIQSSKK